MSYESEQILSRDAFRSVVLEGFFRDLPEDLAALAREICLHAWSLDGRCHTQDWEGIPRRTAVFSLPLHLRRKPASKNYAAIWRPLPPDHEVRLEVILPKTPEEREPILRDLDFSRAHTPPDGHPQFTLRAGERARDYALYIEAARRAKARPLTALLATPLTAEQSEPNSPSDPA